MKVQDLVQSRKDVFSILEETTVHDAARYLRDHKVRSVGVLDASARLVGVVSQSDISDKVAADHSSGSIHQNPVMDRSSDDADFALGVPAAVASARVTASEPAELAKARP